MFSVQYRTLETNWITFWILEDVILGFIYLYLYFLFFYSRHTVYLILIFKLTTFFQILVIQRRLFWSEYKECLGHLCPVARVCLTEILWKSFFIILFYSFKPGLFWSGRPREVKGVKIACSYIWSRNMLQSWNLAW